MEKDNDEQKILTMRKMIVEKNRKNCNFDVNKGETFINVVNFLERDKVLEKSRNVNPFLQEKLTVQLNTKQTERQGDMNEQKIDAMIAQFEQKENNQNLDQEFENSNENTDDCFTSGLNFSKITLNAFIMKLSAVNSSNINSNDNIQLFEQIIEFLKENCQEFLLMHFYKENGLQKIFEFLYNLDSLKPMPYILARILEILSNFPQVKDLAYLFWKVEVTQSLINLCTPSQEQQVLEQLFSLIAFMCSESTIEQRDELRKAPVIQYVCSQIQKYSFGMNLVAGLIVKNGIWLLVSLCSDIPEEGEFDYCRAAVPVLIQFLSCKQGTVAHECCWVLESLCKYYLGQPNPAKTEFLKEFINLGLPDSLVESMKLNCMTTTNCSLQVITKLLDSCDSQEFQLKIINEKVISQIFDLFWQTQTQLVFKVLMTLISKIVKIEEFMNSFMKNELFIRRLSYYLKSSDMRFRLPACSVLYNFINNCSYSYIKEFIQKSDIIIVLRDMIEIDSISIQSSLDVLQKILEACSEQREGLQCLKLKMEQVGFLKILEDLQLKSIPDICMRSQEILERFFINSENGYNNNEIMEEDASN